MIILRINFITLLEMKDNQQLLIRFLLFLIVRGTFLNVFSTINNITNNPVGWNVSYDGFISFAQASTFTTCTQYCKYFFFYN